MVRYGELMVYLSNKISLVQFSPAITGEDWSVSDLAGDKHDSHKPDLADRWLSVDEIAGYLGIKRDTVYKWIDRRDLPAHKVGRLWKFRRNEIDDWVRSQNASSERANRRSRGFDVRSKPLSRGGK